MYKIELNVFTNERAREGEPKEWISLRELWLKAKYSVPYDRWARYTLRNHGVQPRRLRQKTGKRGQPYIIYYVPLDKATPIIESVQRRRHCEISFIRQVNPE